MKTRKNCFILSIIVALGMVIGSTFSTPFFVYAEEEVTEHEEKSDVVAESNAAETSDISDDTVMTSGYSGTVQWVLYWDGHLTLRPVSGDTGVFESFSGQNGAPWSSYSGSIKTVSFEGTIYGAENMSFMFYGHSSLISVDGRNFDTSKVKNMRSMFSDCEKLTSIDLSNFDTSNVTDMSNMFYRCSSLTGLDLSNFDTGNVTDMSSMFLNCSSLTSLNVSDFDTRNVTRMDYMFCGCSSLPSLDVSNFYNSKAALMFHMFAQCSSLTSLDLSRFYTGSAADMSWMFWECTSLESLDLSSFDTSHVTTMDGMFNSCSSLISLDLSHFDTSQVTYMSFMFNGCSSLTSLDVSNFNTGLVTGTNHMFDGCSSLTTLDVSSFDTSSITNMQYMFSDCTSLIYLDLSSFNTAKAQYIDHMFSGDGLLHRIYVSEKWNKENATNSSGMFRDCINLPNFNSIYVDKAKAHYNEGGYLTYTDHKHIFDIIKETAPTCEEDGYVIRKCELCDETIKLGVEALGHSYGEPTYEWLEDNSQVTAKAVCTRDHSHVVTETVDTNAGTAEPTCELPGSITYTAAFRNELFSEQTKIVDLPALGHSFGEPTYEWAEDNSSVTAKAVCEHDDTHVITETVQTTSETVPPTETEDGSTTYTAVFTNELFTTQTKVIVIPATEPATVKVTGVQLNKDEITLRVGKSETLTATVLPENAEDKSVTWTSSDTAVARVDANGKVTAVADTGIAQSAEATITVTTNDGSYTAECKVKVEDLINAFVRRLYKLCFNRNADAGGFRQWSEGLRSGKNTAAKTVQFFFTSKEYQDLKLSSEDFVEMCYQVMMGRASDAGGKRNWLSKINDGVSDLYVLKGFVGSREFAKICADYGITVGEIVLSEPRDQNMGITQFVSRCYQEVLGRKADKGGLNTWCKKILTAADKKQAAIVMASKGFFHSREYLNKNTTDDQYVKTLYRTFLGREADTGGYNNWMKKLASGTSRDTVLMGFANSAEFANIMAKYGIR